MKRILILFAAIILSAGAFGQITSVNKRIMVDEINLKLAAGLIDSIGTVLVNGQLPIYIDGDTISWYTPVSELTPIEEIAPMIFTAAGDTSNYPTPDKVGDLFINTSAGKVYVSVTNVRGGWVILNLIILLAYIKRRKK